jgi:crotonobetainyl-CoA:carnitine CoA-transferase CaiB-like acyl-CoA transferase
MSPHGIFRCAGDDQWVSIACGSEEEWRALCETIGKSAMANDRRFRTLEDRKANEDALEAIVQDWTTGLEPTAVTERLQEAGVAAFPPMANFMLDGDPHLAARDFWIEKEHPEVGVRRHAGIPWRMSETPCEVWRVSPTLGQDNDYVYGELLGMSSKQIADLVERKVIY